MINDLILFTEQVQLWLRINVSDICIYNIWQLHVEILINAVKAYLFTSDL